MPNIHTKVDGVWKKIKKIHVNVGGVWKPIKRVWVNVGGVWKITYSATATANTFIFDHTITTNTNNFNLKNAAIAAGWNQLERLQATVTINSGIVVTSVLSTGIAFDTGQDFPDGTTLSIINNGHIRGRGGKGGAGSTPNSAALNGDAGGTALNVQYPTSVTNNGTIAGGGGGGGGGAGASFVRINGTTYFRAGGGGGGSGANGFSGGAAGTSANNDSGSGVIENATAGGAGTTTTGGTGGVRGHSWRDGDTSSSHAYGGAGGAGGGLGQAGTSGGDGSTAGSGIYNPTVHPAGAGGTAGNAVQGNSAITWLASGTRLGALNG